MTSVAPITGATLTSAGPATITWLLISGKFWNRYRAKIDSSRGKNIRDTTSITAQGDTDDAVVGTSFLSKICDLKEAIFRDCDCER